jgi:hypothetical protein
MNTMFKHQILPPFKKKITELFLISKTGLQLHVYERCGPMYPNTCI